MQEKNTAKEIQRILRARGTPERARVSAWFFKTGKGQYGEGDVFLGVRVPDQRRIAKAFSTLPLTEVAKLLESAVHEDRLTGLLVLVLQYEKGSIAEQKKIVRFYLAYKAHINNWDLVDLSAPKILGAYCLTRGEEKKLYTLVKSTHLWDKRIAIVATYAYIKAGIYTHTLILAELLQKDTHDLIHKAVGWMLREVGKKDVEMLRAFLKEHAHTLPRTTLRYAIERMEEEERRKWRKTGR